MKLQIAHANVEGIGSCTSRVTVSSTGVIYYNSEEDLSVKRFKLYCVVDESSSLRVDFVEIQPNSAEGCEPAWQDPQPEDPNYEVPSLVYKGSCHAGLDQNTKPFSGVMVFEETVLIPGC